MAIMESTYSGSRCATCKELIKIGEKIDYRGRGNTHHLRCVSPIIEWEDDDANALADRLNFYAKGKTVPLQE